MASIKETYFTKCLKLHGEIRKVEEYDNSFTSTSGKEVEVKGILLKVDDDNEDRIELVDKQSDWMKKYKKGMTGIFTMRMDMEKLAGTGNYNIKLLVIDFEEDKE